MLAASFVKYNPAAIKIELRLIDRLQSPSLMSHFRRLPSFSIVAVFVGLAMVAALAFAQGDAELEYKIKAAYLYNFTKFIQWPPKNSSVFTICIVGDDLFAGLIDELETRQAFGKPIQIQRNMASRSVDGCDMAYVGRKEALPKSGLHGVLTVGSDAGFVEAGGMIGFVVEDHKIKLHINLSAIRHSGLDISAKLLEVATVIRENGHD